SFNNPVRLRILKSGIDFEDMISWINIFPKSGKKLLTLSPKAPSVFKFYQRGKSWVTGVFPKENPKVFVISAPGKQMMKEDIAKDRTGQNAWSTLDITDILKNKKKCTLIFRVKNKKISSDLQSTTLIGPVRLVEK
ncbi:MAG: hypothetical protein DRI44_06255, partial [Chlamydiae bacterium]